MCEVIESALMKAGRMVLNIVKETRMVYTYNFFGS